MVEIDPPAAAIKLQLDVVNRSHDEMADLAIKVFELSQTLKEQWLSADYDTKRRILEIVLSNCTLDGPTIRKPFDVLAEGLVLKKVEAAGINANLDCGNELEHNELSIDVPTNSANASRIIAPSGHELSLADTSLLRLIKAWWRLPPHIQQAIVTLVDATIKPSIALLVLRFFSEQLA